MRVGFDLDGVVYGWHASLREHIMRVTGRPASDFPDPEEWMFFEAWKLSQEEFIRYCNEGVDSGVIFRYGSPLEESARDSFLRIKEAGHSIHIVTDRRAGKPGRAQESTAFYLDYYGLPYDSLTFATDKTAVRLDTMLDDKLENYDELDAAGVGVYLMDRPWNRADDRKRRRLGSITEYADLLVARSTTPHMEMSHA